MHKEKMGFWIEFVDDEVNEKLIPVELNVESELTLDIPISLAAKLRANEQEKLLKRGLMFQTESIKIEIIKILFGEDIEIILLCLESLNWDEDSIEKIRKHCYHLISQSRYWSDGMLPFTAIAEAIEIQLEIDVVEKLATKIGPSVLLSIQNGDVKQLTSEKIKELFGNLYCEYYATLDEDLQEFEDEDSKLIQLPFLLHQIADEWKRKIEMRINSESKAR